MNDRRFNRHSKGEIEIGMNEAIWAPWRIEYVTRPRKDSGCVFCAAPKEDDPLILKKETTCYAIMNRFPYTVGHCMVVPYRHVGDLIDLSGDELLEAMTLVKALMSGIRAAMNPAGFNVGVNIGSAAGAGIAEHLHVHIVPRWNGDTNFMPVLSDVSIVSEHIKKTRDRITRNLV